MIYWLYGDYSNYELWKLAKELKKKYNALFFCEPVADIKNHLSQLQVKPKIILIALSSNSRRTYYELINQIKDGMFYSVKQKKMIIMNSPTLIIFSGHKKPDINAFSQHKLKYLKLKKIINVIVIRCIKQVIIIKE